MSSKRPCSESTYVALLRGINVGGKHVLPMQQLAEIFEKAKCVTVRTYIQSGNVIFSAPPGVVKSLPELIAARIEQRFGFSVPVVLRNAEQISATLSNNPFLRAGAVEKALHVYFLADLPNAQAVRELDPNRSVPDEYRVSGREIYLHLPNGMGRTKLTNGYFDSRLSTVCTARNWATVVKLNELMQV